MSDEIIMRNFSEATAQTLIGTVRLTMFHKSSKPSLRAFVETGSRDNFILATLGAGSYRSQICEVFCEGIEYGGNLGIGIIVTFNTANPHDDLAVDVNLLQIGAGRFQPPIPWRG